MRLGEWKLAIIVLLTLAGAYVAYRLEKRHFRLRRREEQSRLTDEFAETIDRMTLRGRELGLAEALGTVNRRVRAVARGASAPDDPQALEALQSIRDQLEADIVYVMNVEGKVLACTPYGGGQTLLGRNYAFRPYFRRAIEGRSNVYPAVGVTTGERGLYYAAPVYPAPRTSGTPVGAVVIKADTDALDKVLARFPLDTVLVNADGIVFATSRTLRPR